MAWRGSPDLTLLKSVFPTPSKDKQIKPIGMIKKRVFFLLLSTKESLKVRMTTFNDELLKVHSIDNDPSLQNIGVKGDNSQNTDLKFGESS